MADTPPAGSLYLLDAHGLIFQMFHGIGPMSAPDGRPTNAVFGVTRSLMSLYDRGADYLIAALDMAGPTFRNDLDTNYKAHRPPPPDDLVIQEPLIHQVLEAMRIPFLMQEGFEADDIMATVASEGAARGLDVYLCSADKDCRQLLSSNVKILNLRKQEMMDSAALISDWGVRPDQVIDYQALVGDSVDNVPGVPGVGPKTAAKWLQELGSLDAIIKNPDAVSGGAKVKASLKEAIANGKLELSKRLVTLDTRVPMALDWEGWKRRDWDGQRLLELFHEFGFRGFAERVRKTMAASGAKKNAEALEIAGIVQANLDRQGGGASSNPAGHAPGSPKPKRGKSKAPGGPSLFDTLMEEQPASAAKPADNWPYDNYQLIDTDALFAGFLKDLKKQKRIVFDLETTALDPLRADIVGYAFSWKAEEAFYLPVRAPAEDAKLDPDKTLAALKPIFESEKVEKVNQNIKYDLSVLESHGVKLANIAGDPMLAHYLLHAGDRSHGLDELTRHYFAHENISIKELIGAGKKQITMDKVRTELIRRYAGEDADTAFRLAALLEPQLQKDDRRKLYDEFELPLIRVLADMEATGIRLDLAFLKKLGGEMATELEAIEKEIYRLAGHEFNIASLKQLRVVLFDEQKLPVQKRTGVTNEPSTDQETLEALAALGHALPIKLTEQRKISKLKGTYVDALPELVNPKSGRVHTSFNQTVASTGRLSSSDPNLQNIPARTEQGKQIRQAFLPREGWTLITADYSQIELRLLAHFCGDDVLRNAFADDRDIHTAVAAEIFKIPEGDVSSAQRGMAKTVNFGVLYGMSATGLSIRLGITKKAAQEFIDAYFARYPTVLNYQNGVLAKAKESGFVATILGRKRDFNRDAISPKPDYRNRNQIEREAINMEIQGSAADLKKLAMLNVHKKLKD
ncbi:MAG TPA: DNA polymerase I, partial [Gemmataceae bacterium]|nr:DNA polymerase I [Gemmataceae bacterium]